MKKTNTKAKSSTPATSAPKAKKKAAPVTRAVAATATIPAPQPVNGTSSNTALSVTPVVPAPVPAGTAPVSRAVKAVAPARVQTKIVARVDVGFGNALYVRGDGPGLSWNQGVPMDCVSSDQWELTLGESARPISFKVLLNDMTWCTGPDAVVASGSTATITPEFA